MRLIDADEMLVGESRAYMSVQLEMDDFLTRQINRLVHLRIQRLILAMPTIEAEPVGRGRWIKIKGTYYSSSEGKSGLVKKCSLCGEPSPCGYGTPYCAICGARW